MIIIGKRAIVLAVAAATLSVSSAVRAQDNSNPSVPRKANQPAPADGGTNRMGQAQGSSGAVGQVNAEADKAADKANRAAVGDAAQNANESEAQKAADRANATPSGNANRGNANAGGAQRKGDGAPAGTSGANETNGNKGSNATGATNRQPDPTAVQVGQTATDATQSVATGVDEVTRSTDNDRHYDPFAIELNPIGLFVAGRISLNAEWVPTTHHALTVSPHIVHTSADVSTSGSGTQTQTFSGFGGEIGYRYYTGHRGMNGVFIGPSLIAGVYNAGLPSGDQPFTNIGIATDLGIQQIFWDHFVLGGGVGLEYLSVSHDFHDLPNGPGTIASSGLKPRLLLEAGYGF